MTIQDCMKSCEYIEVTSLVPEDWKCWFWQAISENAPFSWGDNNRTMVSKDRFVDWCKNVIDFWADDVAMDDLERKSFIDCLDSIPDSVYIDLEN